MVGFVKTIRSGSMDSTGSADSSTRSTGAAFTTEEVKQKLAKALPTGLPTSTNPTPTTSEPPRFHSRFLPGGNSKRQNKQIILSNGLK